jgi:hypothetical protein
MIRDTPTIEELQEELPERIAVYTQSAALLTADWYNDIESDSNYFARPDEDLPVEKIENVAKWIHSGPQSPESRVKMAAHRLVFDSARRTVQANALVEGVRVSRHEMAGGCNDCMVRAAMDLDGEYHPGCEGLLIPDRDGSYEPPDYVQEWRLRVQEAQLAGNTTPDRIANWLSSN